MKMYACIIVNTDSQKVSLFLLSQQYQNNLQRFAQHFFLILNQMENDIQVIFEASTCALSSALVDRITFDPKPKIEDYR